MSGVELKGLKHLKGLDLLLHESVNGAGEHQTTANHLLLISTEILVSGRYQPRVNYDPIALQELADSIRSKGIIQPLIVREIAPQKYEIIAGERRWRAAKMVGLAKVPAVLRNVPDETALAFALIENIQREDLNPIDQAIALNRLQEEFFMSHIEIAKTVGRSRSAVTNLMRLLTLSVELKELLQEKKIEMGHARAILTLEKSEQLNIAQQIVAKGLNVRQTEKLVQRVKQKLLQPSVANTQTEYGMQLEQKIEQWNEILTTKLMFPVKIHWKQDKGKLVITLDSLEAIERLVENLKIDRVL